jgi:hypothetical protein
MNLNKISFALVETRPTKCTLKRKKTTRKQPEKQFYKKI